MKLPTTNFVLASLAAVALSTLASAQTTVETKTMTTSTGTISEFSPDMIVVTSTAAKEPIRYRYTKRTTYVDEVGAPVSLEVVKSGLPVTVHYVREGNELFASKVIVQKVASPAPTVIEKKTTTTTTTTKKTDDDDDDDDDKD
jgi:hypothetical protein